MSLSSRTRSDLSRVYRKFERQIGEYRREDALALLTYLGLNEEAKAFARELIIETYARETEPALKLSLISTALRTILQRDESDS